jgi:hypothetical protein
MPELCVNAQMDFVNFGILSLSIEGWCLVNLNILPSEIRTVPISPKAQNGVFSKCSNSFDYISVIYGDCVPK